MTNLVPRVIRSVSTRMEYKQGWIYWGGGGGTGGGATFHDKAKNNRNKMRYSNLSNNIMISCEQQLQFKYSMLKGARHTHGRHNWASELAEYPLPPHPLSLTRSCWI